MVGLYRHKCTECGSVVICDEKSLDECESCDARRGSMRHRPEPSHDKEIMRAPPDHFACPECGEAMFALSTETGLDWMCVLDGGCGFAGWRRKDGRIREPLEFSDEDHARHNAWSRYQRYQAGYYDYRS